jgi:asparagine synthase (glutamine-hydrolysing)
MPGIVGLITQMPCAEAQRQLLRMVGATCHESFYGTGTWSDESLGLYVGWTARGKDFADSMPLFNEGKDVVLVFSGEEFPEPGVASRLKELGHNLPAEGLAYLVHLYEQDSFFPAGLNGRFHGLLADRARGLVLLFNDRYGMHRLYYYQGKNAFYFAAEAKAILAICPELRRLDLRGLGEFLTCGCVLENRTLYEGIQVLPPASAWVFRGRSLESRAGYFRPKDWEEQDQLEPESYYRALRQIFAQNLPRYFNGHEQIGISLTGGLDTRMIMAWRNAPARSLRCYTFGGPFRRCRDVGVAAQVARSCQQEFEVIPLGREFLSRFSYYAERTMYLTDGCAHVNQCADLYLNERAREIAPVRMTGNYGTEVLRWAPAFRAKNPAPGLFSPELSTHIDAAHSTYDLVRKTHPVSFAVFRQAPWHHHGLLALEQTQVSVRSPYLDNQLVQTVFRAPNAAFARRDSKNIDLCLRLIAEGNAALRQIRTDRGIGGPEGIASAVARRFQEFTFKAEYAYDYGMPQWIASIDHMFSPLHLERLFLGRHKFTHYRVWYRDDLSGYVREMLLDPRSLSRPYLQRKTVERMVTEHLRGTRNFTTEIHNLLTLELVHRLFLDSN